MNNNKESELFILAAAVLPAEATEEQINPAAENLARFFRALYRLASAERRRIHTQSENTNAADVTDK